MEVDLFIASAGTALAGVVFILAGLASDSLAVYAALSQIGFLFEIGALMLFFAYLVMGKVGVEIPFVTHKDKRKDDND